MMNENQSPPTPLPPAAQSPWPAHPAPHSAADSPPKLKVADKPAAPVGAMGSIGALGFTLIGGAVAVAIGLFLAGPALRKRPAPKKRGRPAKKKG